MKPRIAIVGGGVVGLTCADVLAEDFEVTLVAEHVGEKSASIVATAIWHVYLVDKEDGSTLRWAQETLEKLLEISREHPDAGVSLVRGVELFRKSEPQIPSWSDIPPFFELLTEADIAAFVAKDHPASASKLPVRWGYRIAAPAATMDRYLPWLKGKVFGRGVHHVARRIGSIEEAREYGELVVNCAGYGARALVPEANISPVKGQYAVFPAGDAGPVEYIGDDDHPVETSYLIPRSGEVIIGGTEEYDCEDEAFTRDIGEMIDRIAPFEPWVAPLRDIAPSRVRVGLRPYRPNGVLLALDTSRPVPTIHNIGHGGSGFSLSWGCANEVARLAADHFARQRGYRVE